MRCNDSRLTTLLTADEDSVDFQSVSQHVENCDRCQQRLLELSGDKHLQQEVRETLQLLGNVTDEYRSSTSSVVVSMEHNFVDDIGAECEPVSLDFLSPPGHPEMLGRIGRYDVERIIGSGGMGIVLKGFDTELHRVVAIKVLKQHLAHNGAARRRFAREAQSAAAVVHEHVIPIHDVQTEGDTPFLVMQYVPGQSLQARVDQRGPLATREILRIARQAAAGLAAAHAQGVVHRDVKPANILLEESVDRVLISDFGLARTVDDATLTRTGVVAGTPHYMSPEQAGGLPIDQRSDLFSLGSVIYFMCTGRPPFRAEQALAILNRICRDEHRPVDEISSEVSAELAEIVDRLLAKKPADRFRDANEAERHLETILLRLQNGGQSRRLQWKRTWRRWRGVIQASILGFSVVAACMLMGVGFALWNFKDNSPAASEPETIVQVDEITVSAESKPPVASPVIQPPILLPKDTFEPDMAELLGLLNTLEDRWNERSEFPTDSHPVDEWKQNVDVLKSELKGRN